ncbi:hypothetical protein LTS15_010114 [Exophiala xenobiotica]|nr:hypothetical protein LTS15_010114 [Exophiala xenobiotica]
MSASVGPVLNGIHPVTVPDFNESSEFEKILRLRDEVFSGRHPRLTVPAHALRISSSQTPVAVSQSLLNIPSQFPSSASPNRHARQEEDATQVQAKAHGLPSQPASNFSEFDPILLTKSDDLVRAEIHLKRQRLERTLKEQFEQKRQDARRKPAPSEAKPDFDLSTIVAKVLNAPKSPSSKDEGDLSDSLDANSLYSSRAPDSTPDGHESGDETDQGQADEPSGPAVVSAVMGSPLAQDVVDDRSTNAAPLPRPMAAATMDLDEEEEEEGEYSPPEATAFPTPKMAQSPDMSNSRDPRGRPLRRYSENEDNGRRPLSPSEANMRINGRQRQSQRIGRPGSPPSPDDSQGYLPPRKKRRVEKRQERKARRSGAYSPDVKEENVSPPPFHNVQPLGSGRLRPMGANHANQPIVIDDEPAQELRYMPAPERYVESPSRPVHRQVEQLMPLSEPRALSRASMRPMRDDQDLRRVASMHNMRAEAPREYVDPYYETPTRNRAVSYARVGSPAMVESPRYHRESAVEYDRPQDMRMVSSPAPVYREVYDDGEPSYRYAPEPMPPPPPMERIVVDQYGRRFREIIQERPSAVPRAMSVRRSEVEPAYDDYRAARAGSVFMEAGPERSYATADMPPPPVSYRRVAEPMRSSAVPGGAPREYAEPGTLPRSLSVLMDRPSRTAMYSDERSDFREPVRMGSVRPPGTRYDEVQQGAMMARPQSVRPVAREGSVFAHDRPQVSHEYMAAEQPRYRAVEPEQRYFDAQGREVITMDGAMDGRPRGVERYRD